jgi:hypothetical protein
VSIEELIREAFLAGFWEGACRTGECCGCSAPSEDTAEDLVEQWIRQKEGQTGE